jgi:hypothetical protein
MIHMQRSLFRSRKYTSLDRAIDTRLYSSLSVTKSTENSLVVFIVGKLSDRVMRWNHQWQTHSHGNNRSDGNKFDSDQWRVIRVLSIVSLSDKALLNWKVCYSTMTTVGYYRIKYLDLFMLRKWNKEKRTRERDTFTSRLIVRRECVLLLVVAARQIDRCSSLFRLCHTNRTHRHRLSSSSQGQWTLNKSISRSNQ